MADQIPERSLPHNLNAEQWVLGACLVDPRCWDEAASILTSTDFYRDAHRRIWDTMTEMIGAGIPVSDFLLVKNALDERGHLDIVGGPAYVASLADGMPKSANVKYYAAIVKETARLREAIYAANKVLSDAFEAERPAAQIVESAIQALSRSAADTGRGVVTLGDALGEYLRDIDTPGGLYIPTGLIDVDDLIGGFSRRSMTIIAARPSVGKTTFLVSAFDNMTAAGTPVGLISLEMSAPSIAGQMLAGESGVGSDAIRRRAVNQRQWDQVSEASERLAVRPFYIVRGVDTLTQIQAWTRRLRDDYGCAVVGLDYVQMLGNESAADRQRELAYISRGLKRTAEDLDVAMVILSQLSRASESRNDRRPQLSDLRESGALEQDADLALLLFREEMHKPREDNRGVAEVIIGKNRTGPVGTAKVAFRAEAARFSNLSRAQEPMRY